MYKLLDLFCKAGGAGEGYRRAGFEVTGVDIEPQKNYKAGCFIQADALAYVAQYGWMYDAIHASPPCQAHSDATRLAGEHAKQHIDLIPQTRFWLQTMGLPFVIENVEGAKASLRDPVLLCGRSFGLKVYRHRLFESNVFILTPPHYPHGDKVPPAGQGKSPITGFFSLTSGGIRGVTQAERFAAMGIDWMTNAELQQAIPPAFTEFIGKQLVTYLDQVNSVQAPARKAA